MADNLDSPELGSFGIQDTLEMGMGNQQLIEDLLSPESTSTNPEDIKPISEPDPTPQPQPPTIKDPLIKPTKDTKVDNDDEDKTDLTKSDFLSSITDDDDDDDDDLDNQGTKPKDKLDTIDDDDDTPKDNPFTAFSKDLFELGVFTKEEDEDDVVISTPEEFLERMNSEKRKGAIEMVDNFLGQFGDDYKQAFEAIYVKGVNPKEYFGVYNNVVSFAEMDLSLEDNQVKIMKQALTEQGFDPEDVETEIERIKNYGDLEQVATKHHKVLVKKEASKLEEIEKKAERDLQIKNQMKQQYTHNVVSVLQEKLKTKEFDGIPLNPALANELQDYLLVDKWKTPSGETLTDFDRTILDLKKPENHATKVKVALLLKILEKDPTLSTIQKKGVTTKANDLFATVAKYAKDPVQTGGKKPRTSAFNNL